MTLATSVAAQPRQELAEAERGVAIIELRSIDVQAEAAFLKELQAFVQVVMREGTDYGVIPGTKKKSLWSAGADKLIQVYHMAPKYEEMASAERWPAGTDNGFIMYRFRCDLYDLQSGLYLGTGFGACNSMEEKYRWRRGYPKCPKCSKPAIVWSQRDSNYWCHYEQGGCRRSFDKDDGVILAQLPVWDENDDVAGLQNTIYKMSAKRAKVAAVQSRTRSSGLFDERGDHGDEPRGRGDLRDGDPGVDAGGDEGKPPPEGSVPSDGEMLNDAERQEINRGLGAARLTLRHLIDFLGPHGVESIGNGIPRRLKPAIEQWMHDHTEKR